MFCLTKPICITSIDYLAEKSIRSTSYLYFLCFSFTIETSLMKLPDHCKRNNKYAILFINAFYSNQGIFKGGFMFTLGFLYSFDSIDEISSMRMQY